MVERYAIHIDAKMHHEVLERYKALNLAPYKGFVNPTLSLVYEGDTLVDVQVDYSEDYDAQMLRYSRDYATLSLNPVAEDAQRNPQPSQEVLALAKDLRASLRHSMDGMVASSMREKGLHYGINFGLTMEFIQAQARRLPRRADLAAYLLSRDVRELKLIGQIIYPAEALDFVSLTQIAEACALNPELRDCLAKHLLDGHPHSCQYALAWLMAGTKYQDLQALAYTTLARQFTLGHGTLIEQAHEEVLMRLAFATLSADSPYMSAEQKAALLMLKRWGRQDKRIQAAILTAPEFVAWESSGLCLFGEYVDDLKFEFSFE